MPFKKISIEEQFQNYLVSSGQSNLDPRTIQYREIRRTFYAAWATCMLITRDELPHENEDEAVKCMKDMLNQCNNFFLAQAGQNN